eukprot:TRINITY_DN82995_c0_g1_i1.p1 TRINITY_DN82995_c0_g1~~TRINITY_DN82995_c0_g1_i1.p1  ORF type:complete len:507 (+),score=50.60 TRINITY_DN82995_c0_g1_i1:88-1608(+)
MSRRRVTGCPGIANVFCSRQQEDPALLDVASAIFFGGRAGGVPGIRVVAHVIQNRMRHHGFPDDAGSVVAAGTEQFGCVTALPSAAPSNPSQPINQERALVLLAKRIASELVHPPRCLSSSDPTDGALYFDVCAPHRRYSVVNIFENDGLQNHIASEATEEEPGSARTWKGSMPWAYDKLSYLRDQCLARVHSQRRSRSGPRTRSASTGSNVRLSAGHVRARCAAAKKQHSQHQVQRKTQEDCCVEAGQVARDATDLSPERRCDTVSAGHTGANDPVEVEPQPAAVPREIALPRAQPTQPPAMAIHPPSRLQLQLPPEPVQQEFRVNGEAPPHMVVRPTPQMPPARRLRHGVESSPSFPTPTPTMRPAVRLGHQDADGYYDVVLNCGLMQGDIIDLMYRDLSPEDFDMLLKLDESVAPKNIAKKAMVDRLPSLDSDRCESQQCGVCLADYEPNTTVTVLPCGHAFHAQCIGKWLTQCRDTCPLCAAPIQQDKATTRMRGPRQVVTV